MLHSDVIWVRPFATVTLCTLLAAGCGAPQAAYQGGGSLSSTGGGEKKKELPADEAQNQTFMRMGTLEVLPPAEQKPRQDAETPGGTGPQKVGGGKEATAAASAAPTVSPVAPVYNTKAADEKQKNEQKGSVQGAVVDSAAGISEEEIRAVITKQSAAFRRCYDKGLSTMPGFSGAVILRVAISAQGNVAAVEVMGSTTKNQSVDTCVAEEIKRLQFPAKGSGAIVGFPIELGR
ncbi:MAG: AgmX/PglI C-terminal domain-containing protein [Polyangiaceae bacterium]|nr:AgmX/PglI C-terminal domain-containing protein [Polyangiaceae bacterium]